MGVKRGDMQARKLQNQKTTISSDICDISTVKQLAGYYDNQGVWHQQGLTPDQLKEITKRHHELDGNEKANLKIQMQIVLEEKEKLDKMCKSTNDMLECVYSVSDIYNKIIEEEHSLNQDFLDFLDNVGQRNNIPLRQNIEKLFKKYDKECTMDDVIAQHIRQKEAEKVHEFDFF